MTRKGTRIKTYCIGAIIFGIGAFTLYNMRDIVFGTPLSLKSAPDGSVVESFVFPISGNARHAKNITVNGRTLLIDPTGAFSDEIILSPGYNQIEIALQDKFGKEKMRILHVVASKEQPLAQVSGVPTP